MKSSVIVLESVFAVLHYNQCEFNLQQMNGKGKQNNSGQQNNKQVKWTSSYLICLCLFNANSFLLKRVNSINPGGIK